MDAVCLCEYYAMHWAIDFYQKAQSASIKPIIWVELWFVQEYALSLHQKNIGNLVFIAKNKTWYETLLRLVTKAHEHKIDGKPTIDINILTQDHQDIIILAWGQWSFFGNMIMQREAQNKITDVRDTLQNIVWKEHFFADVIAQEYTKEPALKSINEAIEQLATTSNTPLLVNSNFHYIHAEDKEPYEVALAIKDGNKMYDEQRRKVVWDYHIFSEQEVIDVMTKNNYSLKQTQTFMQNNRRVADMVDINITLFEAHFPNYETPQDIMELYKKHKGSLVEKI